MLAGLHCGFFFSRQITPKHCGLNIIPQAEYQPGGQDISTAKI